MKGFFESDLFYFLLGGVLMIVGWRVVKRGRLADEQPSFVERLLMFGGIVVTLCAVMVLIFRSDVLDKPKQDQQQEEHELDDFGDEGAGCSKPKKAIKDFK
jgi:hypothetical protein